MKNLNNRTYLKDTRKQLRHNLTPAEAFLWTLLKGRGLGAKFRRQHSFKNFILDFYCPEYLLAIELDGSQHFTEAGLKSDEIRDAELKSFGITVLRFENKAVFENTDWVLDKIKQNLVKPV